MKSQAGGRPQTVLIAFGPDSLLRINAIKSMIKAVAEETKGP